MIKKFVVKRFQQFSETVQNPAKHPRWNFLQKIINGWKMITTFAKKLHLLFLAGFWYSSDSFQRLKKISGIHFIVLNGATELRDKKKKKEGFHSRYCNETLARFHYTLPFPLLLIKDKDAIVFTDFFHW